MHFTTLFIASTILSTVTTYGAPLAVRRSLNLYDQVEVFARQSDKNKNPRTDYSLYSSAPIPSNPQYPRTGHTRTYYSPYSSVPIQADPENPRGLLVNLPTTPSSRLQPLPSSTQSQSSSNRHILPEQPPTTPSSPRPPARPRPFDVNVNPDLPDSQLPRLGKLTRRTQRTKNMQKPVATNPPPSSLPAHLQPPQMHPPQPAQSQSSSNQVNHHILPVQPPNPPPSAVPPEMPPQPHSQSSSKRSRVISQQSEPSRRESSPSKRTKYRPLFTRKPVATNPPLPAHLQPSQMQPPQPAQSRPSSNQVNHHILPMPTSRLQMSSSQFLVPPEQVSKDSSIVHALGEPSPPPRRSAMPERPSSALSTGPSSRSQRPPPSLPVSSTRQQPRSSREPQHGGLPPGYLQRNVNTPSSSTPLPHPQQPMMPPQPSFDQSSVPRPQRGESPAMRPLRPPNFDSSKPR